LFFFCLLFLLFVVFSIFCCTKREDVQACCCFVDSLKLTNLFLSRKGKGTVQIDLYDIFFFKKKRLKKMLVLY
jgi:hypothetical protein